MLLGGLVACYARGTLLVATSNIPPDELYRNGLQRARFCLHQSMLLNGIVMWNVDAGVDYRLRALTQAHLWLSPSTMKPGRKWINYGWRWQGRNERVTDVRNQPSAVGDVDREPDAGGFFYRCASTRWHDYIALSRLFTRSLFDVPVMTRLMERSATLYCAGG